MGITTSQRAECSERTVYQPAGCRRKSRTGPSAWVRPDSCGATAHFPNPQGHCVRVSVTRRSGELEAADESCEPGLAAASGWPASAGRQRLSRRRWGWWAIGGITTCIVVVAPHVATRTGRHCPCPPPHQLARSGLCQRRMATTVARADAAALLRREGGAAARPHVHAPPPRRHVRHCQQAGSVGVRRAEPGPLARLRVVVCQRRPAGP